MNIQVIKYGNFDNFRFDDRIDQTLQDFLKQNGYSWSKKNKVYYPRTDLAKEQNAEFSKQLLENWGSVQEKGEETITQTEQKTEIYAPHTKKQQSEIREKCKEILQKPVEEITEEDKQILSQYEGGGGLKESNRTTNEVLNAFYTPENLVSKMWEIADYYAPNAKTVLEPSAGIGRFAKDRPNNVFTMHEVDETSAKINKILNPNANVIQGAYQEQFLDENRRTVNKNYEQPTYDIVIGNPPYGVYKDFYKGLGEGKEFDRYEEYFISKGIDALKDENSILLYVVPSSFLNSQFDKAKEIISNKAHLVDAFRLPEGTFNTTSVGTDIIVLKKGRSTPIEKYLFADGIAFDENNFQKQILGEVKERTNRFGREENYVTPRDGKTVEDELEKISYVMKQYTKWRDEFEAEEHFEKLKRDIQITKIYKLNEKITNKEIKQEQSQTKIAQSFAIEKLKEAGIEVIENYEDFEQAFDDLIFSDELIMDKKKWIGARAAKVTNTSSYLLSNPHYYNNLNNINSQVILIQLKKLDNKISNSDELLSAEDFLTELKTLIGAKKEHKSVYLRNLINTNNYTLRFSDHNINSANTHIDEKTTGITIKLNKSRFNDSEKTEVIEFVYFKDKLTKERMLGILSEIENWIKTGEYNYLDCDKINASIGYKKNNSVPSIKSLIINEGDVYGFAYENKIYLNPYVLSSQTPIHEYTHLWDAYIQNTNAELWQKGKEAFKETSLWQEVISDPNYADIADNEDLVLSECHARITGKVAEKVLEKIALEDGEITKDKVIDWDKETWVYIAENYSIDITKFASVAEFIQTPMKNLMEGKKINLFRPVYSKESIEKRMTNPEIDKILTEFEKEYHAKQTEYLNEYEKNNHEPYEKNIWTNKDVDYLTLKDSESGVNNQIKDNRILGYRTSYNFDYAKDDNNYTNIVNEIQHLVLNHKDNLFENVRIYKEIENCIDNKKSTTSLSYKHNYALSSLELVTLAYMHKNGNKKTRNAIEALLEDINYHSETSDFMLGNYQRIINEYDLNVYTKTITNPQKKQQWEEYINVFKNEIAVKILDKQVEQEQIKEENRHVSANEQTELKEERLNENSIKSSVSTVSENPTRQEVNKDKPLEEVALLKEQKIYSIKDFTNLYAKDFSEEELKVWQATDYQGNIDLSKLSEAEKAFLQNSENYVQEKPNKFIHKELFTSGNIYEKVDQQRELLDNAFSDNEKALYENNINLLEQSKKTFVPMEKISFRILSNLAEEFIIEHETEFGIPEKLNLQESFILWARGVTVDDENASYRTKIDFATANISRDELNNNVCWFDIVEYIDKIPVKAQRVPSYYSDEDKEELRDQYKKEAEEKRQDREDIADKLFDRFLHEGLDENTKEKLSNEYNKRFNAYKAPDYSKLPLFIDGMSSHKGEDYFKLYDQQIKGISFLCNKGNGLLAYDVGVGKTACGIVATVNQMQSGRSKRPMIVVPNQVYAKWYNDIRQLFPNVQINDLYNMNDEAVKNFVDKDNPHKLNIPENTISLVTYEALTRHITFTDESIKTDLIEDFAKLVSVNENDDEQTDRATATDLIKVQQAVGASSHVKDDKYYFFEDCGFDNLTVDEAHNFKNLWTIPRPKNKGESNEYSGIPTSKYSQRAIKLFGMTQLVQRHNDNRNVFLLSATPFTNSPLEVYSMLSYVGRERLLESGIYSLRDFLNQFAKTKRELSVSPSGKIEIKQVMKNWNDLQSLQSLLTEFIDKVDGEEAHIVRPYKNTHTPKLAMTDLQKQMRKVDEQRITSKGNSADVLVGINNMRLACVAPALANRYMYPDLDIPPMSELVETSPKLKFVCDSIIDMYKQGNEDKGQFLYLPFGKEAHGVIKNYLVEHGIDPKAIEIINGDINNTQERKEKITSRFNDPKDKLKIIIGGKNTSEGIDLNGNSFVMYNCSLGWNPSETLQAEGRIWRQGNEQGRVHIVYPLLYDSVDSVLYQKHDEKNSRIGDLWKYKGDKLNVEDIKPEELKFDLIKDPEKKANMILDEQTKALKIELDKINAKILNYDNLVEAKNNMQERILNNQNMINHYDKEYARGCTWILYAKKSKEKEKKNNEKKLEIIDKKFEALGITDEETRKEYVQDLNAKRHSLIDQIENIKDNLPTIIEQIKADQAQSEDFIEIPIDEQRKVLVNEVLTNLQTREQTEKEVRTIWHEKMLAEKLNENLISKEEHDFYKDIGYKNYELLMDSQVTVEQLKEMLVENVETTSTEQTVSEQQPTQLETENTEIKTETVIETTESKQEIVESAIIDDKGQGWLFDFEPEAEPIDSVNTDVPIQDENAQEPISDENSQMTVEDENESEYDEQPATRKRRNTGNSWS